MYKPSLIRVVALVAVVLSALGFVVSGVTMVQARSVFFLGVLSWAVLLGASIVALQLSRYPLDEEEYRKVGLRVYFVVGSLGVLLFALPLIGLVLSVVLLITLWSMKRNFDELNKKPSA